MQPAKELSFRKLFNKYIFRIVCSLVIFGTIFALMEIVFNEHSFKLKQVIKSFSFMIQNKSWGHLWYLYMLVGLYLVTPILKRFVNTAEKSEIIYFLAILLLFNMIFPFVEAYTGIKIGFSIPFVGVNLFYYILGYAIDSRVVRIPNKLSFFLIIFSIVIYFIEFFFNVKINIQAVCFESFSNSLIFKSFIPIALFSLTLNFLDKMKVSDFEKLLSDLSFGVYIFHAVFINFIYKVLKLSPAIINVFIIWLAVFVVTSISSFILTYLFRCIPFVKKHVL